MFFGKRRHAMRLIDELGIPIKSDLATELVDMLIAGAKQHQQMIRGMADIKFSDQELILTSAAAMINNQTAFERLSMDFGLGDVETRRLLDEIWKIGRDTALDAGFSELVTRFYDRLPQANPSE